MTSNTQDFKNKVIEVHPYYNFDKFVYINAHTKGIVICPKHGEYVCNPNNLLSGQKCIKCQREKIAKDRMLNIDVFIERVKNIHPTYDISKFVYVNAHTKGIIICPVHGEFLMTPHNLIRYKEGCPNCKRSKKEHFISLWLSTNQYEFTKQKKFPECKDKRALAFDFYINNTNILIEYDGIQHFKPVKRFGGVNALIEVRRKDSIKNKWTANNNYNLIRLNYTQTDEEIINILKFTLSSLPAR